MTAVSRTLASRSDGALRVELSDERWRVVWCRGAVCRELVAIDPRAAAAAMLNRDLREASGAERPDTKPATAQRILDTGARWARRGEDD